MKNYIDNRRISIDFNEAPFVEDFKILNKKTKQAQYFIKTFENSVNFELYDCYKSCSDRKQFVFYYWKRCAKELNATIKIISYNNNFLTIAFESEIEDQSYLFIATPFHNYAIVL